MTPILYKIRALILSMGVLFFISGNIYSQSNDDCLICHDDDSFTMDKDGKEVSIYVNGE